MKILCKKLFGDKVCQASLSGDNKAPVLEVEAGGAPVQLEAPRAMGVQVVEASAVEWEALIDAGFELERA